MEFQADELAAGPWRIEEIRTLLVALLGGGWDCERPAVVAVDGRSSSGKTTFARRASLQTEGAAVVHTDDIAWHQSVFDWVDLLTQNVIQPVLRGEGVAFTPPAWSAHNRTGAITVPTPVRLLLLEGVGSGRVELEPFLDGLIWVQSDAEVRHQRTLARIEAGQVTASIDAAWMSEEVPFFAAERPWERADLIVCGTPTLPHDPDKQAVVSDALR